MHAWVIPELLVPTGAVFVGEAEELERASTAVLDAAAAWLVTASEEDGAQATRARAALGGRFARRRCSLDQARDADLLVLGARGLGSFRGLLLGSVSQQCASHATCPTVVVRPPPADHPTK